MQRLPGNTQIYAPGFGFAYRLSSFIRSAEWFTRASDPVMRGILFYAWVLYLRVDILPLDAQSSGLRVQRTRLRAVFPFMRRFFKFAGGFSPLYMPFGVNLFIK